MISRHYLKTAILFFVAAFFIFFMARWAYSADTVSEYGTSVTLAWDANSESNLAGYKLHYTTVQAGEPYTTTVDVGNVLEYTFNDLDLDANNYWFVATAYSVEGFESGFSNEVTTKPPAVPKLRVKVTVEVVVN